MKREKELLLQLLDEPEICEKIRSIISVTVDSKPTALSVDSEAISAEKFTELQAELERYKTALKNQNHLLDEKQNELTLMRTQWQQLQDEKNMLQEQILQCQRNGELQIERSVTENEKLKQQLEEAISSAKTVQEKYDICRGKLSEYENSYFDIHMYYKKCKELFQANPLLQRDLQNVINLQNEEAFIGAGCQQENLDALWDCLSYKLTVYTEAELKTLNDLFFYFLSIFNDVQELYAPIKTAIGDAFDEDIHARGEGSKISGQIHEVYLEGYRNVKTGKVVKKSIVRI